MSDEPTESDELRLATILQSIELTAVEGRGLDGETKDELARDLENLSVDQLETLLHAKNCLQMLDEMREGEGHSTYLGSASPAAISESQEDEHEIRPDPKSEAAHSEESKTKLNSGKSTAGDADDCSKDLQSLGRYKIVRPLGRGGCGQVYLATDPNLNRPVALKVLLPEMLGSYEARIRFDREARAAAILDHPGIVPVYEAGRIEKTSYISFAFCPGPTLEAYLKSLEAPLSNRISADIVHSIASAIGYAHSKGIVHRDLKPSNLLVLDEDRDVTGSSFSSGMRSRSLTSRANSVTEELQENEPEFCSPDQIARRIRVADFGLVKDISLTDQNVDRTGFGSVIGTPAYMSPEQCGLNHPTGPHSDVFSLGAILYELLVGKPPHRKDSYAKTIRSVELEEAASISSQRSDVSRDLEAICLKCLSKKPSERYATAFELAQDLDNWLQHRPVNARPATVVDRFKSWYRRNPGIAASLAIAFSSLGIGLSAATWKWSEAETLRVQEADARECAELEANTSDEFVEILVQSFRNVNPEDGGTSVLDAEQVLESAYVETKERLDASPERKLRMLSELGKAFAGVGNFRRALECATESVVVCEEAFGRDDERTLDALTVKAETERETGALLQSNNTFDTIYKRLERLYGEEDERTQKIASQTARVRADLGDREQVNQLLQSKFVLFEESDSLNDGSQISSLSEAYAAVGNIERAIELASEDLQSTSEQHGEDHPETVLSMQRLALLLVHPQFRRSMNLQKAVVRKMKELYGPDHYETICAQANLALILSTSNRPVNLSEAYQRVQDAQAVARERFAFSHPIMLRLANVRGSILLNAGHVSEAIGVHRKAYEIATEKLGEIHPESNSLLQNLCEDYWYSGDIHDGVPLMKKASEVLLKEIGDSGASYLEIQLALAYALCADKKHSEAEPIFKFVLEKRRELHGLRHPLTRAVTRPLGYIMIEQRKFGEAEEYFALDVERRETGRIAPRSFAVSMVNLAVCQSEQGKHDEAMASLRELGDFTKLMRPYNLIAGSLVGLADASKGKYEEAEKKILNAINRSRDVDDAAPTFLQIQRILTHQRAVTLYEMWGKDSKRKAATQNLAAIESKIQGLKYRPPIRPYIEL